MARTTKRTTTTYYRRRYYPYRRSYKKTGKSGVKSASAYYYNRNSDMKFIITDINDSSGSIGIA